jgi:hypothetical protein
MPDNSQIIESLPEAEYHARPELSHSGMELFLKNPALYDAERKGAKVTEAENGDDESESPEKGEKEELLFGRIFHAVLAGSPIHVEIPDSAYSINKNGVRSRRGKAWTDFLAKCEAENLIPLPRFKKGRMNGVMDLGGMLRSIRAHEKANAIYSHARCKNELTLLWLEEVDGESIPCRARLDKLMFGPDGKPSSIADWKSARDASPDGFNRESWNRGYHRQAEWYLRAVERCYGVVPKYGFRFIACEKEPPVYRCEVGVLDAKAQSRGRTQNDAILRSWLECSRSGVWQPPTWGKEFAVDVPAWDRGE